MGIEWTLIDQLAIAQMLLFWQERLVGYATFDARPVAPVRGGWDPPRIWEHQAVEQAGAMVDRFHKMFQRTLRSLRELRRQAPQLVVQNAKQVNVADRQVNVVE